jgi:phosphoribosylformimino-5-aminoimidazole carboxamide ribotide isomerase
VFWFSARRSDKSEDRVEIWPAIDLRGGKCVRLVQGDYQRETVFSDDPAAMARHWAALGADRLHLVDLDGARSGRLENMAAIRAIVASAGVECELGGGIRDEATIRQLLDLGVTRLVIGTLAVRQPNWFRQMCRNYPGRLALGIDARSGRVATEGWQQTSAAAAADLAGEFAGEPIAAVIYTDIAADGTLAGPNFAAMAEMQAAIDLPVIASGGVANKEDVARLAAIPMAGCIIGRALYEGTLTLPDALAAGKGSGIEENPLK